MMIMEKSPEFFMYVNFIKKRAHTSSEEHPAEGARSSASIRCGVP
jgi:hypothetical protein